jgi:predicted GNAT family N-acyltransferase
MDSRPQIRRVVSEREFEAALAIRRVVFVDEQGGPIDEEPDALDAAARHYLVESMGQPVGTARLVAWEEGVGKIGRVCLLPEVRGRGWGETLLAHLIADARSLGLRELVLDAQEQAVSFYQRLGFAVEGERFMEVGIPHWKMRRRLNDE